MGGWLANVAALLVLTTHLAFSSVDVVAADEEVVVIVHPSNPITKLSATELYDILTSSRQSWSHGGKILAFNLQPKTAVREHFDHAVFSKDADEVARFWIDQRVRGGAPPPRSVPSAELVVRLVESTPGAIGYVPVSLIRGHTVRVVSRVSGGRTRAP